jgi:hypothetical protein
LSVLPPSDDSIAVDNNDNDYDNKNNNTNTFNIIIYFKALDNKRRKEYPAADIYLTKGCRELNKN